MYSGDFPRELAVRGLETCSTVVEITLNTGHYQEQDAGLDGPFVFVKVILLFI